MKVTDISLNQAAHAALARLEAQAQARTLIDARATTLSRLARVWGAL